MHGWHIVEQLRCLPRKAQIQEGPNVSVRLVAAGHSIAMVPLDDSVAEKPHGGVKREHEHSPAASWEWIAATMKLLQNLYDVRLLVARLGLDLQSEWR